MDDTKSKDYIAAKHGKGSCAYYVITFGGPERPPPFLQILSKDQTINKKLALFTWSCFKLFTIILFIVFIHSAGGSLLSLYLYLIFQWLCS